MLHTHTLAIVLLLASCLHSPRDVSSREQSILDGLERPEAIAPFTRAGLCSPVDFADTTNTYDGVTQCPRYKVLCGGVCKYPFECDYWE